MEILNRKYIYTENKALALRYDYYIASNNMAIHHGFYESYAKDGTLEGKAFKKHDQNIGLAISDF